MPDKNTRGLGFGRDLYDVRATAHRPPSQAAAPKDLVERLSLATQELAAVLNLIAAKEKPTATELRAVAMVDTMLAKNSVGPRMANNSSIDIDIPPTRWPHRPMLNIRAPWRAAHAFEEDAWW